MTSICTVNSACSKSRDQLTIECSRELHGRFWATLKPSLVDTEAPRGKTFTRGLLTSPRDSAAGLEESARRPILEQR
jgi:hypothetical protein